MEDPEAVDDDKETFLDTKGAVGPCELAHGCMKCACPSQTQPQHRRRRWSRHLTPAEELLLTDVCQEEEG